MEGGENSFADHREGGGYATLIGLGTFLSHSITNLLCAMALRYVRTMLTS